MLSSAVGNVCGNNELSVRNVNGDLNDKREGVV